MKKILIILKKVYSCLASILPDRIGYFCNGLLLTGLLGLIRPISPFVFLIGMLYAFLLSVSKAADSVRFSSDVFLSAGLGSFAMQLLLWLYLICW